MLVQVAQVASLSPAVGMGPVYAGLGAAGIGFLGTFGVLPLYKDLLKEPESWKSQYEYLVGLGTALKRYSPEDAAARAKRGALLVDVRLAQKYEDMHPDGSVSVPLYRPIGVRVCVRLPNIL